MKRSTILLAALLTTMAAAPLAAQGRGKAKDQGSVVSVGGFVTAEISVIKRYFATYDYEAKPLPPGIAKNLRRGKPLPPGIAKKQLPTGLLAELHVREGLEVSIVGDRIVLLEASGLIVDVLADIF